MTTDTQFITQTRRALFNATAPHYNSRILPAFGPLAQSLTKIARLKPTDRVIDLGTGTAAVALSAGPLARGVVGVDEAPAMFRYARQNVVEAQLQNQIRLYQGDMSHLPHPANHFDVALASFGFNGIDPIQVFPEIQRVLRPEGRLVFQEWASPDEASKVIKQTFKTHRVKHAEGFLADLRRLEEMPRAWDQLGGPQSIAKALRQAGFRKVETFIEREAIRLAPQTFFRFRTAWTPYQAELSAMPAPDRAALEAEIIHQLSQWLETDGQFTWQPELLRMIAWK